jgi:hypothetical protein
VLSSTILHHSILALLCFTVLPPLKVSDTVVHTCNPSTQEAEAGGSQVLEPVSLGLVRDAESHPSPTESESPF